jgi:pantoate--beta-alanine ligase
MSLVLRARQCVGPKGRVVVSIYVNPTQFGPTEDWATYPRDLPRDRQMCAAAGADILFVPQDRDIYPTGDSAGGKFSTYVVEESLSQVMEGVARPTHFRGVTTIVAKLFNVVLPDVALFGAKDYQQAAIIQRMVRDLNFPVEIIVAPTIREPDGLAMSSRNRYLSPEERRQAVVLRQAIGQARAAARQTERGIRGIAAAVLRKQLVRFIRRQPAARVDYIEFFNPASLQPIAWVRPGIHMALAVFVGTTRLIDNARL